MNTTPNREALIASLTDELTPVQRVQARQGVVLIGAATAIASAISIAIFGFWTGMISGDASGYFWITNGLLLLLGATSTTALVASALPRVGARGNAPLWGAAMLGVVPLAAILSLISIESAHTHEPGTLAEPIIWAWDCAAFGSIAGLLVTGAAIMFLRRGAPVSLERAGWITGIAAGSLGSLAYGITCPLDTVTHVGIVHIAPVVISAVLGRLVVPSLIRW